MRFAAPSDVSGITLSTGPLTVVDGFIDVPNDAGVGDLGGLAVNGFVAAPDDAARTVAPKDAPKSTAARAVAPGAEPESAA